MCVCGCSLATTGKKFAADETGVTVDEVRGGGGGGKRWGEGGRLWRAMRAREYGRVMLEENVAVTSHAA